MEAVQIHHTAGIEADPDNCPDPGLRMVVQTVHAGIHHDSRRPRNCDQPDQPEYLWYGIQ